jgi:hypothetical protein
MIKTIHISKFAVVALLVAWLGGTFLALPANAQSEAPRGVQTEPLASNVPTLVFPIGTIPINRIIYIWTSISGATKYQVQAYQGAAQKLNRVADSSVCISGTCSIKAGFDLPAGTYKWRVRAMIGGVYQPYSSWQFFIISGPTAGFYSPFTSDTDGWVVHKGTWTLESSNYITTPGVAGYLASMGHTGNYSVLTYEVRMKRSGCAGCANVIVIRGNPTLDGTGWWKTEYTFDYTNTGLFSVWKDNNGTYVALKNWTTTTAIKQGGWNNLKVTADGSQLKFYINGVKVWSGSDSAYPSGHVGFGIYRPTYATGDKLWVDWAQLGTTVAVETEAIILDGGMEVPGGDKNMAP